MNSSTPRDMIVGKPILCRNRIGSSLLFKRCDTITA